MECAWTQSSDREDRLQNIVVKFSIGEVEGEKQQIGMGKVWGIVEKICLKRVDWEDKVPAKRGDKGWTKFCHTPKRVEVQY